MSGRIELDRASWDRIASIFERARDARGAERAGLLDQLCGSDLTIRAEVEEMLEADDGDARLLVERRLDSDQRTADPADGLLAPGMRVGPYRIVSGIGSGGMGDVYRAERADGAYRQTVALKVLRPGYHTSEMIRRFRVEREALARLTHPGIAAILDGGTLDDGRPFLVLQLVEGMPITQYCKARELDIGERLRLFLQVARIVQFAHSRLVVHRDIKPSNILVQPDGTPRLLDFGIAKLLDPTGDTSLVADTTPELRLLTLAHAAPEQIRGEAPTTATDVYALGVLLFEMLTGRKPFSETGRSAASLERAILDVPAPLPSALVASRALARRLEGDLDRIVLMALRKEPDRRYVSAAQLADDIERHLAGRTVVAQPDALRYRARTFVARNRAAVATVAAVMVLILAFGAIATMQARRVGRERDRAERERASAEDVLRILTSLFERADPNLHPGGDTVRVVVLLDDAERAIASLDGDTVRQAALLGAVGRMRAARGESVRAMELLRRAVNQRTAMFGPLDVEAARLHHEIALVRFNYEGAAAARQDLRASLAELRRLEGDDHEDVRKAMSDLLPAAADSIESRTILDRLLALEHRSPSRDPIALAERLDARATDRFGARDYVEAASLWNGAIGILLQHLPPEHDDVRTERRNLALAYSRLGQLARAESIQRADVELGAKLRSPATAQASGYEALALTLAAMGHADSAEVEERRALGLFRQGNAPGHWRIWSAERNVAFIVAARGRPAEGLALLDSAVAMARRGPDSIGSPGYLMTQRVPFLLQLGRVGEATRSLADGEHLMGNGPSVTVEHRADVHRYAGMIALASNDAGTAAARLRAAVGLVEPPGKPGTVPGLNSCLLGVALARLGQLNDARSLLAEPCAAYQAAGLTHPMILRWIAEARASNSLVSVSR
jgi:serine/threonine-protein kinase